MRKGRAEALLSPLASSVAGVLSDGCLRGSFRGYGVEAWPDKRQPIPDLGGTGLSGSAPKMGPDVDVFRLKLAGVSGQRFWECGSTPTLASQAIPLNVGKFLYRFVRTEFGFSVDTRRELASGAWMGMFKRMGIPVPAKADEALQQRLIAAGLFDELARLRWGSHPYLPKASFNPHAQVLGQANLEGFQQQMKEALRARGHGEYESALDDHIRVTAEQHPAEIALEVEIGKAKVPTGERFRELLDLAVQIAHINAEAQA